MLCKNVPKGSFFPFLLAVSDCLPAAFNQRTLDTDDVSIQQLCNVGRCLTVEGSDSHHKDSEVDCEFDGKPVYRSYETFLKTLSKSLAATLQSNEALLDNMNYRSHTISVNRFQ